MSAADAKAAEDVPAMRIVLGVMDFGRYVKEEDCAPMVDSFLSAGHVELDNARMYAGGKSEEILGRIPVCQTDKCRIASKANPGASLSYEGTVKQCNESLTAMNLNSLDIFYLHLPDHKVPIEETLRAVNDLHKEGKFKEFGLSNYASWQVVQIWHICKANDYVLPTVYQGMYSAVTREVERELFPALRACNIRFYAYSPLGGGILSGKHKFENAEASDSQDAGRFFGNNWAKVYRDRYWHKETFEAIDQLKGSIQEVYGDKVTTVDAALRWVLHHSKLSGKYGDGLILGSSKPHHLDANLKAVTGGPLDARVVERLENLWEVHRPHCPSYFR